MKSITVVYVHVPNDEPHVVSAKLYVKSVLKFPAGYVHRNLILSQFTMPTPEMQRLFGTLPNCSYYVHDDSGWDIGGFIAAAAHIKDDVMLCLGSSAQVRKSGWLARMMEAWEKHGPGLYGSLASNQIRPHLNTTGFWCAPKMLLSYPTKVLTKDDRYNFEHGPGAFWLRMHNAGETVKLVTWCGEYDWNEWRNPPNISCRGNQENCLTYFRINYEYERCCREDLQGRLNYEMLCDVPTTLPVSVATSSARSAPHKWDNSTWIEYILNLARTAAEPDKIARVLQVGYGQGNLVDTLRQKGIEASSVDCSAAAISKFFGDTESNHDLIVCGKIDEHVTESEAQAMITEMCRHSSQVVFCGVAADADGASPNIHNTGYWIELFRKHGFFPDLHLEPLVAAQRTTRFLRSKKQTLGVTAFSYELPNSAIGSIRLSGPLGYLERQNCMRLHWSAVRNPHINLKELLSADLFVLQNEFCGGISEQIIAAARELDKPVVLELDNLLTNLPKGHPSYENASGLKSAISAMAREADFITVPTEQLKRSLQEAEPQATGKIHVLPNAIDLDIWNGAQPPSQKPAEPFVVGWVGTKAHSEDLALIKPAIAKLARKYAGRIIFKFWGNLPKSLDGLPGVELVRHWQPDLRLHAREMLNSHIDLAIAPLLDLPYNQAASDIRWLENSICYVPGIYSKITPYASSVKHGHTGWLVDNDSDAWVAAIELLMNDHALRRSIAIQAHDEVRQSRSMANNASQWDVLYRSFEVSGRRPKPAATQSLSTPQDRAAAHMIMYQSDLFTWSGEPDQAQLLCDQAIYRFVAKDSSTRGFIQAALSRNRSAANDLRVASSHHAQMAAARAVAETGQKDRAVRLYLDAIVALGKYSKPALVFSALLNTARAFITLDKERGRNLLKIGAEVAQGMRSPEREHAIEKLAREYQQAPSSGFGKSSTASGKRPAAVKSPAAPVVTIESVADVDRTVSAQPVVSIIILALNQLEHTRKCIASLFAEADTPIELILVDNGSTDGTSGYFTELRQQHSNVRVISNQTNRGFAAGNNQGLAIARGDVVVFLNNDTVVTAGWLGRMLAVFQAHPETGLVGPMSNYVSGPQLVTEASYSDLGTLPAFAKKWAAANDGQSFEVGRAVGFCLAARRDVINRIGGLDERFGSGNFEDDDFCIRANLAGYRIRIARDAFVHHTGSQTFKDAKIDYRQAMLRNWDLFRAKWKFPSDVTLEAGYPYPQKSPAGVSLEIALPKLNLTHQSNDDHSWNERNAIKVPQKAPQKTNQSTIPTVASIGDLSKAQELFRKKSPRAAWESTCEAIRVRPHHPEAFLLLAEIARMIGDSVSARSCAQHALSLAPAFKPTKKFLKGSFTGNTKPEWMILPQSIERRAKKIKPTLSVCLIVKNEERFIRQCLASVKDVADQIVVVDTGSTDRTVAIAREFGAEIHEFKWCDDFSAARNTALQHVTGDWVLSFDADEELPAENRAAFLRLLENESVISWRLPLFDIGRENEGCNYVPRLFRNAPGLHFVGRVHEQVFYSVEARRIEWGLENRIGDAALRHHGYTKELIKERCKIERNLRLLELAIEEMPGDPLLHMNLGLELCRSDRVEEGIHQYKIAFEAMSQLPVSAVTPETREALLTQYCTYLRIAKRPAELLPVLTSPLARQGELTASQHFLLGLAQMELEQFAPAAQQMRLCLEKRGKRNFIPINADILTVIPQHSIAICLWQTKDIEGAGHAFQAAIAEAPAAPKVQIDYARFLHEHDKTVDALQLLNQFVSADPKAVTVWTVGGQIALSQPTLLEVAVDWTAVALNHHPSDALVIAQRAEALMLVGQVQDALPLWEKIADDTKPRVLAARILCEIASSADASVPAPLLTQAVSKEFIRWYWRLVEFGAEPTVLQLHANVEALQQVLPTAAELVHSIIAKLAVAETA